MPEPHLKPIKGGTEKTSFNIPAYWMERCREESRRTGKSLAQIFIEGVQRYFEHNYPSANFTSFDENEKYDPTRFYTFGEDKKGHSYHGRVSLPKTLAGRIGMLVESGRIPEYRTMQHFLRDAAYHRAEQLSMMLEDGELRNAVSLAQMASEELSVRDEIIQGQELIEAFRMSCEALYAKGAAARLRDHLASREEIADQIPEMFQDEWIAVLREYTRKLRKMEKRGG